MVSGEALKKLQEQIAAMDLERYGDVRVVKILVERPREHEQLHL